MLMSRFSRRVPFFDRSRMIQHIYIFGVQGVARRGEKSVLDRLPAGMSLLFGTGLFFSLSALVRMLVFSLLLTAPNPTMYPQF